MSDKILKEAFDRLSKIESRSDIVEGSDEAMEGIEVLTDIQDKLFEVIEELNDAIRAYVPNKYSYWQSYGLAQLKIVAGSDEYATRDQSINNLIKELQDNDEEGDY